MTTIPEALQLVADRITKGDKHPFYDRVTKLATLYRQLITGEDHESLLMDVFKGLTPEELAKIMQITFPITSSVSNALMFAFSKVLRTEPISKVVDFNEDAKGEKLKATEAALDNYYAGSSLDYYIEKRFHDLSFIDPNSFIVTEFKDFNALVENASPYPFEVSSTEAVNYKYKNKVLEFLLVENVITYKDDKEDRPGVKLTIYLENDAIVFTQVKPAAVIAGSKTVEGFIGTDEAAPEVFKTNDGKQFNITYAEHKQGRVPAIVVGYVPDKKTRGITYVNPFHYGALPYMMKSIKSVAEMDITASKHAFPQKLAYTEGCKFDNNQVCSTSGERIDQCKRCGGKGYQDHDSSKDVIRLQLPRDKADMYDLEQLLVYKYPEVDGIKWMQDYINELRENCYKSTFNSEVFSKNLIVQTATSKTIELQNVYDTLYPYAQKISDFWQTTVTQVARFLDYEDAIARLKYPKDFKLKNLTDLLADLKSANDSNSPLFVRNELTGDIAVLMYADKPLELQKFNAKMKLVPFPGKTKDEILMGINASLATKQDAVLWLYFDALANELESESLMANASQVWAPLLDDAQKALLKKALAAKLIWFYDLPYTLQVALLQAKVVAKIAAIQAEQPAAQSFAPPMPPGA